MSDAETAKEVMRLIQKALRLAPRSGLYLAIKVTEAKK